MAILPLIIAPDPVLKQKSRLVEAVDDPARALLNDMLDTMYHSRGIGLAAVQVGVLKKLIVMDVTWREDSATRTPLKLINAKVLWDSEEDSTYNEGCLSFPDQFSDIVRPKEVKVGYIDEWGQSQEILASGLLATCLQHEIDHTDGVTFVDHISRIKRDIIHNKLRKAKKRGDFDVHVHGEHCNH